MTLVSLPLASQKSQELGRIQKKKTERSAELQLKERKEDWGLLWKFFS